MRAVSNDLDMILNGDYMDKPIVERRLTYGFYDNISRLVSKLLYLHTVKRL